MKTLRYSILLSIALTLSLASNASADTPAAELKGHTEEVHAALFSPNGKKIVTASEDETARIWDAQSGKELLKLKPGASVDNLRFSSDGKKLLTVQDGNAVQIWDADSESASFGKELQKKTMGFVMFVSPNQKKIFALESGEGSEMLADADYEYVQIWDTDSGQVQTLKPKGIAGTWAQPGWHPGGKTVVSPNGTRMVTIRSDENGNVSGAQIWDTDTGRMLRRIAEVPSSRPILNRLRGLQNGGRQDTGSDSAVHTALFSRDGSKIATHHMDETVHLWDAQTGRELHKFTGSAGDCSPDGTKFAAATEGDGEDGFNSGTVSIYDVNTGKKIATAFGTMDVRFSTDGKKIMTQGDEGIIRVWDIRSDKKLFELKNFSECLSLDSKIMVIADGDGGVRTFDAESGKELGRWKGMFGAMSSDSKKIALLNNNAVQVWALP